jgi:hypothetical protein
MKNAIEFRSLDNPPSEGGLNVDKKHHFIHTRHFSAFFREE